MRFLFFPKQRLDSDENDISLGLIYVSEYGRSSTHGCFQCSSCCLSTSTIVFLPRLVLILIANYTQAGSLNLETENPHNPLLRHFKTWTEKKHSSNVGSVLMVVRWWQRRNWYFLKLVANRWSPAPILGCTYNICQHGKIML
jgi:hypothetical protein